MAPLDGISRLVKSKRGGESFARNGYKTSQDVRPEDESTIPLLPRAMADDKIKSGSPVVDVVGSDSESSGRDVASPYKKAPWWSYIWVSQAANSMKTENNYRSGL
jgi:hypothetical protein